MVRAYFCQLIHFLNWILRNILEMKLSGFAEVFIFLTPAPVVSVFSSCLTSYCKTICYASNLYLIQFFVMNMTFISSREAKNVYFI